MWVSALSTAACLVCTMRTASPGVAASALTSITRSKQSGLTSSVAVPLTVIVPGLASSTSGAAAAGDALHQATNEIIAIEPSHRRHVIGNLLPRQTEVAAPSMPGAL